MGQVVSQSRSNDLYAYTGRTAGTDGYTNNGLNQVTAVNATGVSYDADGNLTSDGVKSYVYDAANRPVSTNGGTSTLSYDPLGRLRNMVGSVGGQYLYEGEALAGVALNGGSTVANRIIQGPWPDEIAVAYQGSGTSDPRWSLQDRLGSVVAITDGSAAVNVINAYDEYGRPQSGNGGRMQYTGQLWLPDFGVYHYKARQYHPGLGRFLQTDPIGYAAGANLYGYVAGDPVNYTDPLGLVAACIKIWVPVPMVTTDQANVGNWVKNCSAGPFTSGGGDGGGSNGRRGGGDGGEDNGRTAGDIAKDALQCAARHYGFLAAGAALSAAGVGVFPKAVVRPGESRYTSVASRAARAVFGDARFPGGIKLYSVTTAQLLRGQAPRLTSHVARFAGRAVPVLGAAILLADVVAIGYCTVTSDE